MKLILLIIVLFFLFENCSTWKNVLVSKGNSNDAIKNAIADFSRRKRFLSHDSVFNIYTKDITSDIIGVSIFADRYKLTVYTKDEQVYSYATFPTNYFQQDGNLFYWKDSTVNEVPQDLKNKLYSMNRVDTIVIGKNWSNRPNDDGLEGVNYYFCKSNLRIYKAIISNRVVNTYQLPQLNCK